jgi:hypothetical protein
MRQTGESQMPAFRQIRILLLASLAMPLLSAAGQLDEPTYDENVYVNCQYRLAVIFPKPPAFKDFTYTSAGKTAPARQFYTQEGTNQFSVTVVEFANGPAVDENLVMAATIPLQQRGQVRFQYMADYDPGIPGRQLDIFQPERAPAAGFRLHGGPPPLHHGSHVRAGRFHRAPIRTVGVDPQCAGHRPRQERQSPVAAVQLPQVDSPSIRGAAAGGRTKS